MHLLQKEFKKSELFFTNNTFLTFHADTGWCIDATVSLSECCLYKEAFMSQINIGTQCSSLLMSNIINQLHP